VSLTAEALFRDVFLPLYPEDAKSDLGRARSIDANPANNPSILAQLAEIAETFVAVAPTAMGAPDLALDFSDASVHRLSAHLTKERRDALLAKGELANVVVHGAAYVGECIRRNHGGRWAVRRPLWESLVALTSRAGEAELPIFHWWLKSLADDAPATLADRYRAHVEVPTGEPEALPVIAPPDRALPPIKQQVRYDVLYKYLKAHLPELRDVGEHFPSPERFADLALKSLSFLLVGGGRMLIMAGHNQDGMHAFWLTKEGFEKSAFWPCDAFPAPILRKKDDEKLEVVLSHDGSSQSFELLWWGP
jgi:hypothetical protein